MVVDAVTGEFDFNLRVTPAIDLSKLTVAEKDALILSLLPLVGRLESRRWRGSPNWRSGWPPSSGRRRPPENSSLPPSVPS